MRTGIGKWALASGLLWLPVQACAQAQAVQAPAQQQAAILNVIQESRRGDFTGLHAALQEDRTADEHAILRGRLAAARFDPAVMTDPDIARIAAQTDRPDLQVAALSLIAGSAFAHGDYARAAEVGAQLTPLFVAMENMESAAGNEQMRIIAAILAAAPEQRVDGSVVSAAVPAHYDAVGLPRLTVALNGGDEEAIFDTGANLSVLSESAAEEFGVEIIDIEATVGNAVGTDVGVRIGVADTVVIAGTVLRDVAFLVIDDSQLTFPIAGGYSIRAIIGMPILRALGRFGIVGGNAFHVAPPRSGEAPAQNLYMAGNDIYAASLIAGRATPLHLDTGAVRTSLTAAFSEVHPEVLEGLETTTTTQASAGGQQELSVAQWMNVPVTLGGYEVTAPELRVTLPGDTPYQGSYGTLGSDLLQRFADYTIDLSTMTLEFGAPLEQ